MSRQFLRSAIKCAICLRWPQARMYFYLWRQVRKPAPF
jgi:hypothetical protein